MNIKSFFNAKLISILTLTIVLSGGLFYFLYKHNVITIPNIFMQGLVINITPEHKIKNIDMLVNLKFHISEKKLKKPISVFKFFNAANKQIFEVVVQQEYHNSKVYHYQLSKEYLKKSRENNSFLKMFCNSWTHQCGITFAFSKYEPLFNLPEDIKRVTLDNEEINFTYKNYDYTQNAINHEIAQKITDLKYEYTEKHIKVCTKFDSFQYTEALRITTKKNDNVMQKVCTKEDTHGMCCELIEDTKKFESISILHWKGSWNQGKFTEYSIEIK